jgi:cytoskeletal protein RodZ
MSGHSDFALDAADDLGAALRRHREAAGRTLRDLADTTKLGVRTLDALERNQVEKLPPGIFYRAVVRAYAREVGLDPEDTLRVFLARYPDDMPPPGPAVGPVADGYHPATVRRQRLVAALLLGGLAVIAVGMLWWWQTKAAQAPAPVRPPRAHDAAPGPPASAGAA